MSKLDTYKGYEVNAINTGGFWYGYTAQNGKVIWQDGGGFIDRNIAVERAKVYATALDENDLEGYGFKSEGVN